MGLKRSELRLILSSVSITARKFAIDPKYEIRNNSVSALFKSSLKIVHLCFEFILKQF